MAPRGSGPNSRPIAVKFGRPNVSKGRAKSISHSQNLSKPQAQSHFVDEDIFDSSDSDEDADKDEVQERLEEAELEKLVFGDAVGFREGLKKHKDVNRRRRTQEDEAEEDQDEGLQDVPDNDVGPARRLGEVIARTSSYGPR
jgi:hypothetical protein